MLASTACKVVKVTVDSGLSAPSATSAAPGAPPLSTTYSMGTGQSSEAVSRSRASRPAVPDAECGGGCDQDE